MLKSRRKFLVQATAGVLGAAVASRGSEGQSPVGQTPGAPPTYGTATPVGPEVSASTFAEAAKLADVEMTPADLAQAAGSWRRAMAPFHERRTGPRKVSLEPSVSPWSRWDPVLPGTSAGPQHDRFVWSRPDPGPLPGRDEDIAFAPLTHLA
ncbi:MAG TPA: twin-arginine translocation signal domain-containing protein, partial [Candidatus Saccharimonadales bacterium]|nr:twin-arginine translocation signal domain-containing protein [Candidatus Saccharimonadales bacterium]